MYDLKEDVCELLDEQEYKFTSKRGSIIIEDIIENEDSLKEIIDMVTEDMIIQIIFLIDTINNDEIHINGSFDKICNRDWEKITIEKSDESINIHNKNNDKISYPILLRIDEKRFAPLKYR